MDLIIDVGRNICKECGVVNGYDAVPEYIDFYENKYKMRRNSVYIRKYHIVNTINDIAQDNNIQISNHDRNKILRIFQKLIRYYHKLTVTETRMIGVKFILRRIFRILGTEYKCIPLSKSKKSLKFYNIWWKQIYKLIKDDIYVILKKQEVIRRAKGVFPINKS